MNILLTVVQSIAWALPEQRPDDATIASVSVAFAQNFDKRFEQDLYIQPKTPVVDVP